MINRLFTKSASASLIALFLSAPAFAADDFAINNATGGFTILRCIEASGVCTLATQPMAATPATGTGSDSAVTVTSTSAQALAAGSRRFLYIGNESVTATIACNLGGTAVINTAGNFTIPPMAGRQWDGTFIPSDAVNCISSVASSPATIQVN